MNKLNEEQKKEVELKKQDIDENNKEIKKEEFKEFFWRAPEFNIVKKGLDWYILISLISLILIIFAIFQKNFLFIVFILLVLFLLIYNNKRKPQILEFKILKDGINIGNELFLKFEDLEGFSFRQRPGLLDDLVFKKKEGFNRYIFLPIDNKSGEEVRKILIEKLKEFNYEPGLFEILFERFL